MKIYLNVYDLAKANYYLHSIGFGIYHTGIQVGSVEYHFGGHEGSSTGVVSTEPKDYANNVVYRETLFLGDCSLGYNQINSIIEELKRQFPGNSYDVLSRNCNHFSNAVCQRLLGKSIPSFVNRMASLGQMFRCCIPGSFLEGPESDPTRNQPVFSSKQTAAGGGISATLGSNQFTAFKGKPISIGASSASGGNNKKNQHARIPEVPDDSQRLGINRQQNDLL